MTRPAARNLRPRPPEPDSATPVVHALSVRKLCRMCNPLAAWAELDKPITRREVLDCIRQGSQAMVDTPLWTALLSMPAATRPNPEELRDNHVRKVAWFVVHGVRDPIHLDVGIPSLGCWVDHVVEDGHHRLAGAWIRGDATVQAHVSGSESHARELGLWNPGGESLFRPSPARRPSP